MAAGRPAQASRGRDRPVAAARKGRERGGEEGEHVARVAEGPRRRVRGDAEERHEQGQREVGVLWRSRQREVAVWRQASGHPKAGGRGAHLWRDGEVDDGRVERRDDARRGEPGQERGRQAGGAERVEGDAAQRVVLGCCSRCGGLLSDRVLCKCAPRTAAAPLDEHAGGRAPPHGHGGPGARASVAATALRRRRLLLLGSPPSSHGREREGGDREYRADDRERRDVWRVVKERSRYLEGLDPLPHQLWLPIERTGDAEDEALAEDEQRRLSVDDEVAHNAERVTAHAGVARARKVAEALDDPLRRHAASVVSGRLYRLDEGREEERSGADVADAIIGGRGEPSKEGLENSRGG